MRRRARAGPDRRPGLWHRVLLVLLDVVVRDRGGRLVRDLRADEFEVYEDGKRQSVAAFDIITTSSRRRDARGG